MHSLTLYCIKILYLDPWRRGGGSPPEASLCASNPPPNLVVKELACRRVFWEVPPYNEVDTEHNIYAYQYIVASIYHVDNIYMYCAIFKLQFYNLYMDLLYRIQLWYMFSSV